MQSSGMTRPLCIALLASSLGFAPAAMAGGGLFSATGEVIAILAGELFVGTAEGHLDGAGTLAIRSQKNPALHCLGSFTSTAKLGGAGGLRCSDGSAGTFRFQRLSLRRGHGSGSLGDASLSFAYGLSAGESTPYLTLPAGKKLAGSGSALHLVDL